MPKVSTEQIEQYAGGIAIRASAGHTMEMARELAASRMLIASFERMLDGCREQTFAGYENGDGENIGDEIEARRHLYSAL